MNDYHPIALQHWKGLYKEGKHIMTPNKFILYRHAKVIILKRWNFEEEKKTKNIQTAFLVYLFVPRILWTLILNLTTLSVKDLIIPILR